MKKSFGLYIIFLLVAACGGGGGSGGITTDPQSRGDLVSSSAKSSLARDDLSGLPAGFPDPIYAVNTYRLVYRTRDIDGNIINVSGLLAIPVKDSTADSSLLVYHHGTIFEDVHAPTNFSSDFYFGYLSSQNYIVLVPDYIGYGESASLLHPYVHAESLGMTTVDMLRAVRQYLQANNIASGDSLFLAGYSEGGYAAMAAHKIIERDYADEFTVTASIPAAGSYDLSATLDDYFLNGYLENLPGLMFAFAAYDDIYDMNRLNEFFQSPYNTLAGTAFYGTTTEATINEALAGVSNIADLFMADIITNYATENGEAFLKARVAENDIYDWKPLAPVRLYHGSNDLVVKISNSETALSSMQAYENVDVTLEVCAAANTENFNAHLACINPYNIYMLETIAGF